MCYHSFLDLGEDRGYTGQVKHLGCKGLNHAGINSDRKLASEVELWAEGLSLEGGLQGRDSQLQLLIGRKQGQLDEGMRAQLLCSA